MLGRWYTGDLLMIQTAGMQGQNGYIAASFSRANSVPADVSAIVEFSTNLVTDSWSTNTVCWQGLSTNGTIQVQTRSAGESSRMGFFRLKALSQ